MWGDGGEGEGEGEGAVQGELCEIQGFQSVACQQTPDGVCNQISVRFCWVKKHDGQFIPYTL